jgi:PAP2 superfamily
MTGRLRREIALGVGVYALALAVRARNAGPDRRRLATRNAARLVALEQRLGIHFEPSLQRLLLRRPRLLALVNGTYVAANIGLTLGVLWYLRAQGNPAFIHRRRAAVACLVGSQAVFLPFPTDPPRRLEHFVDASSAGVVDIESAVVSRLYNPVAAMPSIHMAWAVVVAGAVRDASSGRLVRTAALAYPPAVAATVVLTANHLLVDVAAGALLGTAANRACAACAPGARS